MIMTFDVTDEALREVFARRARRVGGDGLLEAILTVTVTLPQRRGYLDRIREGLVSRSAIRVLALAAILAALLGIGVALVGSRAPRLGFPTQFVPPFTYAIPPRSQLVLTFESSTMYAFTEGARDGIYGGGADSSVGPGARGVTVTALVDASTHPCPMVEGGSSRVQVRDDPAAFLEDLRLIGGIGVGQTGQTLIDGRPAMIATVDPAKARCEGADFHVPNHHVKLAVPSVLMMTRVDQRTVVFQIWASPEAGLEAWIPAAREFLNSIDFDQ